MNIPVLIEPTVTGFRASGGVPFAVSAEGMTENDAIDHLRDEIRSRMSAGAKLVSVEVEASESPWLAMAGMFPESSQHVQEWLKIMEERRQQDDLETLGE